MNNTMLDVIKLDPARQEKFRYSGRALRSSATAVLLEAFLDRPIFYIHGIEFAPGDRFIEAYFTDRWYNIFEMHAAQTGQLKGWYCNICQPAELAVERVTFVDLYLDLLVYPDGRSLVLDEDELLAANLPAAQQQRAWAAVAELQAVFGEVVVNGLERWFVQELQRSTS